MFLQCNLVKQFHIPYPVSWIIFKMQKVVKKGQHLTNQNLTSYIKSYLTQTYLALFGAFGEIYWYSVTENTRIPVFLLPVLSWNGQSLLNVAGFM